jgi:hypothetical protein
MRRNFTATTVVNVKYLLWRNVQGCLLRMCEIRVRIKERTKRTRELVVVTTLLDATKHSAFELKDLFMYRRNAEIYIISLKITMGMEMLRSKRPDTVRKDVAMHLLACNSIRGIMAEAARGRDVQPRIKG